MCLQSFLSISQEIYIAASHVDSQFKIYKCLLFIIPRIRYRMCSRFYCALDLIETFRRDLFIARRVYSTGKVWSRMLKFFHVLLLEYRKCSCRSEGVKYFFWPRWEKFIFIDIFDGDTRIHIERNFRRIWIEYYLKILRIAQSFNTESLIKEEIFYKFYLPYDCKYILRIFFCEIFKLIWNWLLFYLQKKHEKLIVDIYIFIYLFLFYQIILHLFGLSNTLSNFICRLSIRRVIYKLQSIFCKVSSRDTDLICKNRTLNAMKSNGYKTFVRSFLLYSPRTNIWL